jgi:hypothetical protein
MARDVGLYITLYVLFETILLTLTSFGIFNDGYLALLPISFLIFSVWILFIADTISQTKNKTISGPIAILKFIGAVLFSLYIYALHNKLLRTCYYKGSTKCIEDSDTAWYKTWTALLFPLVGNSAISFVARFVTALARQSDDGSRINLFYNKDPSRIVSISLLFPINAIFALLYADDSSYVQGIPLILMVVPLMASIAVTTVISKIKNDTMVLAAAVITFALFWPVFAISLSQRWLMWIPHVIGLIALIIVHLQTGKSIQTILFGETPTVKASKK